MAYSSRDLESVEGLEPIRRRPEMYVGPADAEHSLCGRLLLYAVANIAASTPVRPAVRLTLWSGNAFTVAFDGEPLSIALRETRVTSVPHPELYHRFMYLMDPGADLLGAGAVIVNALSAPRRQVNRWHSQSRSVSTRGPRITSAKGRTMRRRTSG